MKNRDNVWTEEAIWLRNKSAPIRDIMRFVLVYHGPLSSAGNKKSGKQPEVRDIREALSAQLSHLWATHAALSELQDHAWELHPEGQDRMPIYSETITRREMAERYSDLLTPLWGDIYVGDFSFRPLVRKSLHLACDLDIQFLRQEDPGALITQAGDLDGRIKLLLDALRMPSEAEIERAPPSDGHTFCLMESDTLVSSLNVDTERLLFPQTEYPNEVHLVIEVALRVLRVTPRNTCLL